MVVISVIVAYSVLYLGYVFIYSFLQPLGVLLRVAPDLLAVLYLGSGLATYVSARRGGLCCRAAGIPVHLAGSGRGTQGFFRLLCWPSWIRYVPVSVCLLLCQCFDFSVWLSRVHRWMILCGMFRLSIVSWWTSPSICLLLQGKLQGTQCDFRFNRLAQGAVDLANSLGICRCILSPSAQGESRIRCHPVVCYSVIFHRCGVGVFDLSLRQGWFCIIGVLFVVSIVVQEFLLLVQVVQWWLPMLACWMVCGVVTARPQAPSLDSEPKG